MTRSCDASVIFHAKSLPVRVWLRLHEVLVDSPGKGDDGPCFHVSPSFLHVQRRSEVDMKKEARRSACAGNDCSIKPNVSEVVETW